MTKQTSIGFIGLGVMGEPMCRNLARKSGTPVIAFDLRPEPLARLAADGVARAASVREIMEQASGVMLSLPSGSEGEAICAGEDGLLPRSRSRPPAAPGSIPRCCWDPSPRARPTASLCAITA